MGLGLGKLGLSLLFKTVSNKKEQNLQKKKIAEDQQQLGSFVDLGLSVKWSENNLEISSLESMYYGWGETCGGSDYCWKEYYFYDDDEEQVSFTRYNTSPKYGRVDGLNQLLPNDDPAFVEFNMLYPDDVVRMPSVEEYRELIEKCQWTFCEENQVVGYRVTGPSGNSIFMPAMGVKRGTQIENNDETGCYWTNHLGDDPMNAHALFFDRNVREIKDLPRFLGCKVRCVMDYTVDPEKSIYKPEGIDLNTKDPAGPIPVDLGLSVKWSDTCFCNIKTTPDVIVAGDWATHKSWCKRGKQGWQLPTADETKELIDKCQWQWSKYFGCDGYKVIGPSGHSIFIPAWNTDEYDDIPPCTDDYHCDFWTSTENGDKAYVLRVTKSSVQIIECSKNEKAGYRPVFRN